jgi:hypothetical protein
MSKPLAKTETTSTALREAPAQAPDLAPALRAGTGFFSFSYTVTELAIEGERTRVSARQTRLENGRLTTETFEGELDRSAYDHALREAQQQLRDQLQAQMAWMQRALAWWLPLLPGHRAPRD